MGWGVSQWKMVGKQICDRTPQFIMPPLLECEPLLSQPWASCQSEETWWITKAQPHRLSGCISRSLWRGGWNFLCLAITVGWGGRHSSWGGPCILSVNILLTKRGAFTSDEGSSEPHSEKGIGKIGKIWFFGKSLPLSENFIPKLHFLDGDVWLWKPCWFQSLLGFHEQQEKLL